MNPATGFLQLALTQRAASPSALPPISPMISNASLGGSAAYRVSDGAIVSYLTPEGGVTTLTGGPLGGMVPAGDHLFISANGSANTLVWNAATDQVLGSYALVLGGLGANDVLPLRIGDLLRARWLATWRERIPVAMRGASRSGK